MSTVQITCSTPDSQIYYTLDGNDPDPSSNLYSAQFEVTPPLTVKAKAYKEGYDSSDISSFDIKIPVVPMVLSDNSILFYDRGEEYGSYHLNEEGYPVRDDGLVDEETAESQNWRYLICEGPSSSTSDSLPWTGTRGTLEGVIETGLGYGLPNTNTMIINHGSKGGLWAQIKEKRELTGFKWFLFSNEEAVLFYENIEILKNSGISFLSNWAYWTSTENNENSAYHIYLGDNYSGELSPTIKNVPGYCIAIRRI